MNNTNTNYIPIWTVVVLVMAILVYAFKGQEFGFFYFFLLTASLITSVMIAVHNAEVVAVKIGEPLGTLVLAIAVTTIEVALIISLMIVGGDDTAVLARDTVFAAEMIIINGIVGGCLLIGGMKYKEQRFGLDGVSAALTVLTAISVLALILPNFTTSTIGPSYNSNQLIFVGIISLILYGGFLVMQTIKHRDYFLQVDENTQHKIKRIPPNNMESLVSVLLLIISLVMVVMLAKVLAPGIESGIDAAGAPKSLVGIIIAMVVLLPEAISALGAARKNKLQSSLNLALGSALASIGLTIPAVAFVSLYYELPLTLGIDIKSTVLFILSLFILSLSLRTGRTTMLQGVVLLVIFAVYLFITIVP